MYLFICVEYIFVLSCALKWVWIKKCEIWVVKVTAMCIVFVFVFSGSYAFISFSQHILFLYLSNAFKGEETYWCFSHLISKLQYLWEKKLMNFWSCKGATYFDIFALPSEKKNRTFFDTHEVPWCIHYCLFIHVCVEEDCTFHSCSQSDCKSSFVDLPRSWQCPHLKWLMQHQNIAMNL